MHCIQCERTPADEVAHDEERAPLDEGEHEEEVDVAALGQHPVVVAHAEQLLQHVQHVTPPLHQ